MRTINLSATHPVHLHFQSYQFCQFCQFYHPLLPGTMTHPIAYVIGLDTAFYSHKNSAASRQTTQGLLSGKQATNANRLSHEKPLH